MEEFVIDKKLEKIYDKYKESLISINDLTAGEDSDELFFILIKCFGYLLDNDPEKSISQSGVTIRKNLNFIIKKLGPKFLLNPQVIENRNMLKQDSRNDILVYEEDEGITLPKEPVIWVGNHAFKDDVLASIIAIQRHAYILFGSLPHFYNTTDAITAWLNGVAMVNRKVKNSRQSSIEKGVRVLNYGTDMFVFPEGVWNKTPNQLLIHLWPGIYKMACETGAKVVPVAHYFNDCVNDVLCEKTSREKIHSVIDDPIRIDDLSEKAALTYVRDAIATWYYLMLEKYGQSTRKEELMGFDSSDAAWRYHLQKKIKTTDFYDEEIELTADYRPKDIILPEKVWEPIINSNADAETREYAKQLVKTRKDEDYQRNF